MLKLFQSKKPATRTKILLVDDQPDLLSTVEYRLRFAGCEVVTASNGQEGLAKAASEHPDLILLDKNMPIMNGQEMLERLRADPSLKSIPVIMLTAQCESQDIAGASALGISDYVTKPFDFTQLMDKVHAAVGHTKP
jgi:two-component system cell cycle response regulator